MCSSDLEEDKKEHPTSNTLKGSMTIVNEWTGGATIDIYIENLSSQMVTDWRLEIRGVVVENFWNVSYNNGILSPVSWNNNIYPNDKIVFGMKISGNPDDVRLILPMY